MKQQFMLMSFENSNLKQQIWTFLQKEGIDPRILLDQVLQQTSFVARFKYLSALN